MLQGYLDVDGDALSVTTVATESANGSINYNGNGTWTFTPAAENFKKKYLFSYLVTDGELSIEGFYELQVDYVDDGDAAFKIAGTAAFGQQLSAEKSVSDADGDGVFTHTWQSSADGVNWRDVATGANFEVGSAEEGKQIRMVTSYTDGQGFAERVQSGAVIVVHRDANGDGFMDEVTNYQMYTASGGVDLRTRRFSSLSDQTSPQWNIVKAVEIDSGFLVLLEGERSKDGEFRAVTSKSSGLISGATGWLDGRQIVKEGYEDIFGMDINGDSSIGITTV